MHKEPQRIELRGTLTSADMQQMRPTFVDVPQGVTDIHFTFRHSPHWGPGQKLPHQISIMIFDTNGPRFEISQPDDEGISINTVRTSPGGINGPHSRRALDGVCPGLPPAVGGAGRILADGRYGV